MRPDLRFPRRLGAPSANPSQPPQQNHLLLRKRLLWKQGERRLSRQKVTAQVRQKLLEWFEEQKELVAALGKNRPCSLRSVLAYDNHHPAHDENNVVAKDAARLRLRQQGRGLHPHGAKKLERLLDAQTT